MEHENAHGGIRIEDDGSTWVLWGDVDHALTAPVADELLEGVETVARLTLDLGAVTFMDSAGLRLILLAASQRPTKLRAISQPVNALLEMTMTWEAFGLRPGEATVV
ncbi:STAS domain-containing protein [Luteimicrobium subarcticum]|uniref:Anti-anti-sigma factor n=1 Tax=Luteimicrobium subarcticum TaxID=620910 RepID=A0A2M8W6K4_9MICO|nr:STAS domain-containing protein [Luteimicrobium subarcticum]PJI86561.1 anti-anti-sigma factor [Luteimicrobium subarcticum]